MAAGVAYNICSPETAEAARNTILADALLRNPSPREGQ